MNIIINGGTKGIGRETVIKLAQIPGSRLLVTGRDSAQLGSLAEMHPNVSPLVFDLSEFDMYSGNLVNMISSEFRTIDIMINMAGLLISKSFMEITEKESRSILETNFFGPASVIRLVKPFLIRGAHIVNISSMGGFQGSAKYNGLAYYSAAKAAIACLTECLAVEFSDDGISVNCLALGSVQTEMLAAAFPGYKAPVTAAEMGEFIADFALRGHKVFNGKILPVAVTNP
ncbi:MAG TPA: SDR family oxidoreductase [Bacteroidales bacterium]|nr:SDR family oxidoreductase [Bacteroidales bacterium]